MAMHVEARVHETPLNPRSALSFGVGVGWTVQRAPSQRSASVIDLLTMFELGTILPTAVQAMGAVHEMASKTGCPGPAPAIVSAVQRRPSQPYANPSPTAVHALAVAHETAAESDAMGAAGGGRI
jgi:hypothetical protein